MLESIEPEVGPACEFAQSAQCCKPFQQAAAGSVRKLCGAHGLGGAEGVLVQQHFDHPIRFLGAEFCGRAQQNLAERRELFCELMRLLESQRISGCTAERLKIFPQASAR